MKTECDNCGDEAKVILWGAKYCQSCYENAKAKSQESE